MFTINIISGADGSILWSSNLNQSNRMLNETKQIENLKSKWKILSYSKKQIHFKLDFTYPNEVSSTE